MDVVFVSGVVFVEQKSSFDFAAFGVSFNVVDENLFIFCVLEEDVLVEEEFGVRDERNRGLWIGFVCGIWGNFGLN